MVICESLTETGAMPLCSCFVYFGLSGEATRSPALLVIRYVGSVGLIKGLLFLGMLGTLNHPTQTI